MEASRKHGAFDGRWACVRKESSVAIRAVPRHMAEVAEGLDWDGFSARYFADGGRHDAQARSAYAAYRQGREWREIGSSGLSLVPSEASEEAGTQRLLAAIAVVGQPEVHGGGRHD